MQRKTWAIGAGLLVVVLLTCYLAMGRATSVIQGKAPLSQVVKIYIPSTVHVDQPIDNTPYVDRTLQTFSQMFGGATALDGTGAWLSDQHALVKEKVTIVYSFTSTLNDKTLDEVVAYARHLKNEMTQSSITLEVNGKMYFIE